MQGLPSPCPIPPDRQLAQNLFRTDERISPAIHQAPGGVSQPDKYPERGNNANGQLMAGLLIANCEAMRRRIMAAICIEESCFKCASFTIESITLLAMLAPLLMCSIMDR